MNRPHYSVVFCTPGDILYNGYTQSLMKSVQYLNEKRISWTWMNDASPHIAKTRALILNHGYAGNDGFAEFPEEYNVRDWEVFSGQFSYDQIVWIDNDISWKVQDLVRLLNHQEEVVSGVYMFGDSSNHVVASTSPKKILHVDELLKMNQNELHEVHTCGMGFLKVRQGVIEQMLHPIFLVHEYSYVDKETNQTCYYKTTDEDTSFCHRVRQTGRRVYLDPQIRVSHYKRLNLVPPNQP